MSVSSCHTAFRQLELDGIRLALGQQPLYVTLLQHRILAFRFLCKQPLFLDDLRPGAAEVAFVEDDLARRKRGEKLPVGTAE